jgi:iron complex transport system ATP-binding protein
LLRAADVTFSYRPLAAPVLSGVSLDVPANGFVGILGPNGSGKTTLLRLLAGTRQPSRGNVLLDDVDLARMARSVVARRMAVVPQDTHLAFDFTALEVVLMGRYPHLSAFEIEGPRDIAIARDALTATGTLALEDRLFDTLSGGERQRVVIASALAQQPDVLLLDEPTASLDLGYQLEVASLLRRLSREHDVTMVMATHDLNLAASMCDALALLRGGRLLRYGPTADVLSRSAVRELYDVEADVQFHQAAGHLTVTPVRRVG